MCRAGYRAIFKIPDSKIVLLTEKMLRGEVEYLDERGTHANRPHRISIEVHDSIYAHILSFPTYESHYARAEGEPERRYLEPALNVSEMYDLWIQMRRDNHDEQECSENYYRRVFNLEFDLKFGQPKADTCDSCDRLNARVKIARSLNNQPQVQKIKMCLIFIRFNLFLADESLFSPETKKMSLIPRGKKFIESLFFPDTKKMSLFPRGQNSLNLVFFHVFVVKSSRQSLNIIGLTDFNCGVLILLEVSYSNPRQNTFNMNFDLWDIKTFFWYLGKKDFQ